MPGEMRGASKTAAPTLSPLQGSDILTAETEHMRRKLWHCYCILQAVMVQEAGQDLVEYAMVFVVIALAATAGMQSVAGGVSTVFTTIGTTLHSAVS
jgi:Flp pilus assembly pilin Flp